MLEFLFKSWKRILLSYKTIVYLIFENEYTASATYKIIFNK